MTSISDVLKASKGVPVDDIFAELWGRKLSGGYTIDVYTGTLPAVLTGTKAGYLHGYKIYGNLTQNGTPTPSDPIVPQECGERTNQLFDYENGNYQNGQYKRNNGTVGYYAGAGYYAEYIPVEPNSDYFLSNVIGSEELTLRVYFYDIDKNWISRSSGHLSDFLITTPSNCKYIQLQISESFQESTNYMLNSGSTALPYEPYGYKLPLTSGSTPVDIYIGDDTLSTEEYVDSGTGKVYHMVDGVLTPTDPPVPFPQIPTSAGSTTISWAGEGLAPSQVELEYERRR